MTIDVRPEVLVHRPPRQIHVRSGLDRRNHLQPPRPGGPPRAGRATVERTARFLGRTFTYGYLVTAQSLTGCSN